MTAAIKNSNQLEAMNAYKKIRLRDNSDGSLLHQSGEGKCTSVDTAWIGLPRQAKVLESNAKARRKPWPFAPIPRAILDKKSGDEA
jgi:hypothetical protein